MMDPLNIRFTRENSGVSVETTGPSRLEKIRTILVVVIASAVVLSDAFILSYIIVSLIAGRR